MLRDKSRIDFLDFMRVFAFLSVLIGHLFNKHLAEIAMDTSLHLTVRQVAQLIYDICFAGAAGVVVFFMTSGYIITHVLQHERTGEFVIRRIFRIYPLYIVAILSEVVVTHTVMSVPLPSLTELISRLLLVGDFFNTPNALGGVEWTLRIEILFYGFMAVLKATGLIERPKLLPLVLGVMTLILFFGGAFPHAGAWTDGYLNIFGPFLFVGVMVYLVEKKLANPYLCFALIFLIAVVSIEKTVLLKPALKESNYVVMATLLFLAGWALRGRIVSNAIIKTLSEMTYAIYLFHLWSWGYLEILVVKIGLTAIPYQLQQIILLFVLCYVATKTVEKYGVAAGRSFIERIRNSKAFLRPA
ncbi:acyltransferase family protein [Pseudomonas sp. RtIB026]|uniref:acyltransferase family protein n=1 Tax=Pseudomonas sp. RtIB026 TaxID=2749999 RepID=UPI00194470C7|nr:acyltransferase [Pseudomonas sp. RtIB026]